MLPAQLDDLVQPSEQVDLPPLVGREEEFPLAAEHSHRFLEGGRSAIRLSGEAAQGRRSRSEVRTPVSVLHDHRLID
jgi:hypothetical protein